MIKEPINEIKDIFTINKSLRTLDLAQVYFDVLFNILII